MRAKSAWWVYKLHLGRPVVLGPFADSDEADRDNWANLSGEGESIELHTIDRTMARDMVRKKILDRTGNLDDAMKRARYKVNDIEGGSC